MSFSAPPLPSDEEYNLSSEDSTLLKRVIGIQDDGELKRHLLAVQAEAYAVHPYACIRSLGFAKFRISKHPAYEAVIKLGKERQNAILLDLPCCGLPIHDVVGSDSRKAIYDGYPRENVIASDLYADYWTVGHKLFKTTEESYSVPFLQGDMFDPNFLKPGVRPVNTSSQITTSPPSLAALTSLTPLQHHVSVIYTSSFFHLFEADEQFKLAHLFASLLSPLPGSIIFGSHVGASEDEEDKLGRNRFTLRGTTAFAHSPASWKELWTGESGPFTPEQVLIQVKVVQNMDRKHYSGTLSSEKPYIAGCSHIWSITRR
ncbi:hypothetical protein Clacol_004053 [Clathrus columnatus]|uniref:Uncharacterized protein n=1 Tax=Clathrus columnatus TaxID=1419009 RepID=A0AAV5A9D2_9AGAM|nr:hypothetical protein Clacol_004053 [Clathrus columnatus]